MSHTCLSLLTKPWHTNTNINFFSIVTLMFHKFMIYDYDITIHTSLFFLFSKIPQPSLLFSIIFWYPINLSSPWSLKALLQLRRLIVYEKNDCLSSYLIEVHNDFLSFLILFFAPKYCVQITWAKRRKCCEDQLYNTRIKRWKPYKSTRKKRNSTKPTSDKTVTRNTRRWTGVLNPLVLFGGQLSIWNRLRPTDV